MYVSKETSVQDLVVINCKNCGNKLNVINTKPV